MAELSDTVDSLVREVLTRQAQSPDRRLLVAIAGAPGSGKSTIADAAADRINQHAPGVAAVLPMDGYHYDDHLLDRLGRRARKGAPDTCDVDGFRHMLIRLKDNVDQEVAVPVFDREIEIARAGARLICAEAKIILCEGNYLLLRRPSWDRLKPIFDFSVFVKVEEDELRRRLIARWQGYGLTAAEITAKVEENDLPNGVLINMNSARSDLVLMN